MAKKTTKKAAAPKKATAKKATAKKTTAKKAAAPKATAKKATAKAAPKATAKKVAAPKKKTARKPNAAFMKPLNPSKELAEIVGGAALPRTEVMKKVWAYIKKNNLQDAKNRRAINADDKLKAVFGGKKQVTMFEMTKLVSNHLK
jgi:upstream activation factor subunit UAF30